jgi:hypothetical protein
MNVRRAIKGMAGAEVFLEDVLAIYTLIAGMGGKAADCQGSSRIPATRRRSGTGME